MNNISERDIKKISIKPVIVDGKTTWYTITVTLREKNQKIRWDHMPYPNIDAILDTLNTTINLCMRITTDGYKTT